MTGGQVNNPAGVGFIPPKKGERRGGRRVGTPNRDTVAKTVDSIFLLFFAGFMLMAVTTFILMEMRRSGRAASVQARHSRDAHEHRHLAFSLARVTPGLVLMILVGAAAVFFLLPRMSAGYLGGYSFGTDLSTGFIDRVQLGRIGQIQQSNAVVMHIQINGDKRGQYALHWRGVALASFDGKNGRTRASTSNCTGNRTRCFPYRSSAREWLRPTGRGVMTKCRGFSMQEMSDDILTQSILAPGTPRLSHPKTRSTPGADHQSQQQ